NAAAGTCPKASSARLNSAASRYLRGGRRPRAAQLPTKSSHSPALPADLIRGPFSASIEAAMALQPAHGSRPWAAPVGLETGETKPRDFGANQSPRVTAIETTAPSPSHTTGPPQRRLPCASGQGPVR